MKKVKKVKKSKKSEVNYERHFKACSSCLNYQKPDLDLITGCYFLIREHTTKLIVGKPCRTYSPEFTHNMCRSVLKNMKQPCDEIFPSKLINMNFDLSCPFHTLMEGRMGEHK